MTGPAEMTRAYVAPAQPVSAYVFPEGAESGTNNAQARMVLTTNATPSPVEVMVTPTQVRRPWRTTLRSAFQMAVALATLLPFLVAGIYQDADAYPAVVLQVLAVSSAITRVMALPQVERFLADWAPFLAAAPAAIPRNRKA